LYERLEPVLNAGRVVWIDEPKVEQEALGLLWRGNKITHPGTEHDDYINAVAGVVAMCTWQAERQRAESREDVAEAREREQQEAGIAKWRARFAAAEKDPDQVSALERRFAGDKDQLRRELQALYEFGSLKERMDRGFGRNAEAEPDYDDRPD
jgi:hypothetical protein